MENKEGIRLLAENDPERIVEIARLEKQATEIRKARNLETPGRYKDAAEWSRTVRGGRQFPLFPPAPSGGCMRWGLCDVVREDPDE
jgi:hypothetical protein